MPLELMKKVVGVLPRDSTVIDPFAGSGTTLLAARELGMDYAGIEIDEEYYGIAVKRLEGASS